MFIVLQFPFVDLRLIQKQEGKQFFYPNKFKERTSKKVYYRHFGSKHYREKTDGLPQSEYCFYNSKKILKLDESIAPNCTLVFARLFAEEFFFHFDIGIRVTDNSEQQIDLLKYIEELLKKNIFITLGNICNESSLNIESIKSYIESLYIYATTYTDAYVKSKDTVSLTFGSPAVFCQYSSGSYIIRNKGLKTINIDNFVLKKTTINLRSTLSHVWITEKYDSYGETKEYLRNLRICLMKLYNYREGLSAVFQFLEFVNDFDNLKSDIICIEFNYLRNLLKKPKYRGVSGKEIMDMALEGDRTLYNDAWENHIERLNYYYGRFIDIKKERLRPMSINIEGSNNNVNTGNNSSINSAAGGSSIIGDVSGGSVSVNTSGDVRELMGQFMEEYNKLLAELKLSKEDMAKLDSHKEEFKAEVSNAKPEPQKVKSVWDKIKSVFSGIVSNADKLTTLYLLGEKVVKMF